MAQRTEIVLDDEQRAVLERWARRPKSSQALAFRSAVHVAERERTTKVAIVATAVENALSQDPCPSNLRHTFASPLDRRHSPRRRPGQPSRQCAREQDPRDLRTPLQQARHSDEVRVDRCGGGRAPGDQRWLVKRTTRPFVDAFRRAAHRMRGIAKAVPATFRRARSTTVRRKVAGFNPMVVTENGESKWYYRDLPTYKRGITERWSPPGRSFCCGSSYSEAVATRRCSRWLLHPFRVGLRPPLAFLAEPR